MLPHRIPQRTPPARCFRDHIRSWSTLESRRSSNAWPSWVSCQRRVALEAGAAFGVMVQLREAEFGHDAAGVAVAATPAAEQIRTWVTGAPSNGPTTISDRAPSPGAQNLPMIAAPHAPSASVAAGQSSSCRDTSAPEHSRVWIAKIVELEGPDTRCIFVGRRVHAWPGTGVRSLQWGGPRRRWRRAGRRGRSRPHDLSASRYSSARWTEGGNRECGCVR